MYSISFSFLNLKVPIIIIIFHRFRSELPIRTSNTRDSKLSKVSFRGLQIRNLNPLRFIFQGIADFFEPCSSPICSILTS